MGLKRRFAERRHWARADARFRAAWPAIDSVEGWCSQREAEFLFTLARVVPAGHAVVEIGSYEGRSTAALASGVQPDVPVFAVDPHTGCRVEVEQGKHVDTWPKFQENIARIKATSVIPLRCPSVDAAAAYDGPSVGMLFVDGWHSGAAVVADFKSWQPHLAADATVVFVDWFDPEIARALDELTDELPPRAGTVGKDILFAARVPGEARRLLQIPGRAGSA